MGNIVNRVFDSSGPEGKVRGTPQQIIDKYLMLARDAQLGNDRVAEQNFLQHAEHYARMLSEAQRELDAQRQSFDQQRGGQEGDERGENGQGGQGGQGGRPDARQDTRPEARQDGRRDDREDRRDRRDDQRRDDRGDDRPGAPQAGRREDSPADVIDIGRGEDGPGLVETPEMRDDATAQRGTEATGEADRAPRPPRQRRPRRPRGEDGDTGGETGGETGQTPEAAE